MKKIFILLMILVSTSLFAEGYDLSYKFKDGEVKKWNVLINIEGVLNSQINSMQQPFKSQYKGVMSQKTILNKDNTAKQLISFSINEIQTNETKAANMVAPKSIGYEINPKGKILNILNEKGNVVQKVNQATEEFPVNPISIGTSWQCITSTAGINLVAKSTLNNTKKVNDEEFAFITKAIETPIDVATLMKLMNISTDMLGAYDQLQFQAYCKGTNETMFNITKGETNQSNDKVTFYLQGSLYGNVIMQGQFNITYEQKIFTPEEYSKKQ